MELENNDQGITIVDNNLLIEIRQQLKKNADVISMLSDKKTKDEEYKLQLEKQRGELAFPVTNDFCKKYFNVSLETMMSRRKGNPNIVIYGKGQEKFMFKEDIEKYIKSLGINNE